MPRDFEGHRVARGWGQQGGEGELARRLAAALRELLENAPMFDELQGRGQQLTTWESVGYRDVKRRGWEVVKEAERQQRMGS